MKVSKCGEKTAPKELTWDEMLENEGVYRPAATINSRLIVIRHKDDVVVLYLNEGRNILEPADGDWHGEGFFRVNETVCFELKPA